MDIQKIKDEAFREALVELKEENKKNLNILKKIEEIEKNAKHSEKENNLH